MAKDNSGPDKILPIDWDDIAQGAKTDTNYQLLPGDRLYIVGTDVRIAERFVDLMIEGDFDRRAGYFDEMLKRVVGPKTLKSLWEGFTEHAGKLKGRGPSRVETSHGFDFVFVPVIWENRKIDIRIAFDKKGRIGGYVFVPPGKRLAIDESRPSAGRATIVGKQVILDGAAPVGGKISFHAGDDRGNGWSCPIPKRSLHFTVTLEKDSQGLNCQVALDSDDTILAMQHVQQIGSAEIAKGQFTFVEGWPSVKEDGACTVQIGEWTASTGKKVPVYVTVSPAAKRESPLAETPEMSRNPKFSSVTYPVGDLVLMPSAVVDVPAPPPSGPGSPAPPPAPPVAIGAASPPSGLGAVVQLPSDKADFDSITELIFTTVAPDSWRQKGGKGTISHRVANLTISVFQTQEVHEEIVDLLEQLRRMQTSKSFLKLALSSLMPSTPGGWA